MLIEAESLQESEHLEADICIVGAGIAGLAVVREFLDGGQSVLLLESGAASGDGGANQFNETENAGLPYLSPSLGRTRGFGGTSELWAGQCTPLNACDFARRGWVPLSGWPISFAALDPYHRRASEFFGLPVDAFDESNRRSFTIDGLGLDPALLVPQLSVFSPKRFVGREHRDRVATSDRVRAVVGATVTELCSSPSGRAVAAVEARTRSGKRLSFRARAVVLAGGAIENARLLLASSNHHPRGLGNGFDQVGRCLQDHVIGSCQMPGATHQGTMGALEQLVHVGALRWAQKFRLAEDEQRLQATLNATASIVYDYDDGAVVDSIVRVYRAMASRDWKELRAADVAHVAAHPFKVLGFGARHMGYTLPAFMRPTAIRLSVISEQAPNPDSRVTLTNEVDRLGMPRARVDWRLTDLERGSLLAISRACRAEFSRLGLDHSIDHAWLESTDDSWKTQVRDILHAAGTTRMSSDPASGVVDSDCKLHEAENVFVASTSVFPTSGHSNPVFTMTALAIRLADHLKAKLGKSGSAPLPE